MLYSSDATEIAALQTYPRRVGCCVTSAGPARHMQRWCSKLTSQPRAVLNCISSRILASQHGPCWDSPVPCHFNPCKEDPDPEFVGHHPCGGGWLQYSPGNLCPYRLGNCSPTVSSLMDAQSRKERHFPAVELLDRKRRVRGHETCFAQPISPLRPDLTKPRESSRINTVLFQPSMASSYGYTHHTSIPTRHITLAEDRPK